MSDKLEDIAFQTPSFVRDGHDCFMHLDFRVTFKLDFPPSEENTDQLERSKCDKVAQSIRDKFSPASSTISARSVNMNMQCNNAKS